MALNKKCPECGEPVEENADLCMNCGHVFKSLQPKKEAESLEKPVDSPNYEEIIRVQDRARIIARRRTIRFLLIAAIAIVAVVFFFVNSGTKVNDDKLFPDKALQQYLSERVDTNHNGKIDDNEINATTRLDGFEGRNIKSLEGLEMFKNLESLDVSNAGIEKLFRTYTNQLFTNHEDEELVKLKVLNLSGNNLESLSFSDSCPNLEELYCSGGALERIYLEKQDELSVLDCSHNQLEGDLDLSDTGWLKTVDCSFNQIEFLDLPPSVISLNCSDNLLTGIHFATGYSGDVVTLNSLYCQNNQIVSVVSGSGIAWNNVHLADGADCDLSGNPGIRVAEYSEGGQYIEFDELNP